MTLTQKTAAIGAVVLFLSACGQRGPLVLPTEPTPNNTPDTTAAEQTRITLKANTEKGAQ